MDQNDTLIKAHIIIDRRLNDNGKSTPNRARYVGRVKEQVREAVKKTITDGNIKDIVDKKGKKVKIPGKGLNQPTFHHSRKGGKKNIVHPGNKEFDEGDRIPRPEDGEGGGGEGSNDPSSGDDGFEFTLTREEFLDLFFEDLELPDLVKQSIAKIDEWVRRRAGFATDGNPATLNIERSAREAKKRRVGLGGKKKKKIAELKQELEQLQALDPQPENALARIVEIEEEIAFLTKRIKSIPFIDDFDLRYNQYRRFPKPATQAVMFCIMDVSGSMDEWMKEMAKRFFMLLFLFLNRNYERVEIIFLRHHTIAKEVDEQEFFYSTETGGTLVSPALELMENIIKERFSPTEWNIFACQASDGDNWLNDSTNAQDVLKRLLRITQYFAYVEIQRRPRTSDLWPYYETIAETHQNFVMNVIDDVANIYPVFRKLFEKRDVKK